MQIRLARPDELDLLTELCMISKQSNGYSDAFMEACRDELRVTPDLLAQEQFWVAEILGQICGCVCLIIENALKTGEVSTFFVHPDHQRQGVGRALWDRVVQSSQEKRLTKLHLDADPAAVPSYGALGFRIMRQVPSGSIPGRFLPYMERDMS